LRRIVYSVEAEIGKAQVIMHRLVVFYPLDPRGAKVGGIETHVRLILANFPADFLPLFVGVDEIGDKKLGVIAPLEIAGRVFDFLPVVHIPQSQINIAAKSLLKSTTFRYVVGILRHIFTLKKGLGDGKATAELQRFETALIPKLLGIPAVQTVHGEGSKDDKMDSLIKKLWFIHSLNERIALSLARKIICVNSNIVKRMERLFPRQASKAQVMTVSVDTKVFRAQPFDTFDGVFRVIFAGRLDEFKDPPLMFKTFAALNERLSGRFEFHYVGMSDPERYAEFASIKHCTVLHGFRPASQIAKIASLCHAGVLTSFFEGMPCYLLEVLSVGRPFVAIRLPQYDAVIIKNVSGELVERKASVEQSVSDMTDAFIRLWAEIRAGRIDPQKVHECIESYSVDNQMSRLFDMHREL
jgi:glycosyltransferase involved in cell wall biosynthesis